MVIVVRAYTARIRRRPPHRVIYGSASVMATVLITHVAIRAFVPTATAVDGVRALPELVVVLLGCCLYLAIETVLIGQILRLTKSPRPSWRVAAGTRSENTLEACTLLAGVLVATSGWWWAPLLAAGPVAAANIVADRNAQLGYHARTDPLTRLLNRDGWAQACVRLWARASQVAVLLIDLDYFKTVNDKFGHPAGDAVLVGLASTLSNDLRKDDAVLARFGGEEIVVAVSVPNAAAAQLIAERLRAAVGELEVRTADNNGRKITLAGRGNAQPVFDQDGMPFYDPMVNARRAISVSVGVAISDPVVLPSLELLIAAADKALYDAKGASRNTVAIFLPPQPSAPAPRATPPHTNSVSPQPA